jgi:uracil-DNA glycosylase family 4
MQRPRCPHCNKKLVPPTGPEDSDILLCGPFPGYKEIIKGVPWIGKVGDILKAELSIQGIQFDNCRVTNLWQHEPTDPGTKRNPNELYETEVNWHFDQLLSELHGRKAVLIMGSLTSSLLGLGPVSKVAGQRVDSELIPETVEVAIAMQNPAQVLHGLVGETRYAIEAFAVAIRNTIDATD